MNERDLRRLWLVFWGVLAPALLAACASQSSVDCPRDQFAPVANPPVIPVPGQIDYCPPATIGIASWATATPFPTEAATPVGTQHEVNIVTPMGATPEIHLPDQTPTFAPDWGPTPVNILHASRSEVEQEADQGHDLYIMVEQTEGGPVLVIVPKEQALRDPESIEETGEMVAEGVDRVQRSLDMEAEDQVIAILVTETGESIDIHGNVVDSVEMQARLAALGGTGAPYLYLKQSPEGGEEAILEQRLVDLQFAEEGIRMGEEVRKGLVRVLAENGLTEAEIESLLFLHFGSSANGYAEKWHSDVEIAIVQRPESRDMEDLNYKLDGVLRDPANWEKVWEYSGIDQTGFTGIHVLHVQVDENYDPEMSTVHKIEPWSFGGIGGLTVVVTSGAALPGVIGRALVLEGEKKRSLAKLKDLVAEMGDTKKGVRDLLRRGNTQRLWTHVIPDLKPLHPVVRQEAAVIAVSTATINEGRLVKQLARAGVNLEANRLLFRGVMEHNDSPLNKEERSRVMFWRELKADYPDLFAKLRSVYIAG